MLGGKIVEEEHLLLVLAQALDRRRVLGRDHVLEQLVGGKRILFRRGQVHVVNHRFRLALDAFRHRVQNVGRFVHPASLAFGRGEDFRQGLPEPERSIT